jgi:DNA-binding PadR family transcriptional regulator
LPAIQDYFATEEGQREFAAWQAEWQKSQLNNQQSNNKESR